MSQSQLTIETTGPSTDIGDIAGLLSALARNLVSIAFVTFVTTGIALAYVLFTQPTYTSSAVLYINPTPPRVVNENTPSPASSGADLAIVDSQISIMGSDRILRAVVERLSLDQNPDYTGVGFSSSLRERLFPSSNFDNPTARAVEKLAKRIKLIRSQKTYIIEVEASATSPILAAQIANTMVDVYIADQTQARSDEARRASELINGRLEEIRAQAQQAERRLDEFKKANNITVSEGGIIDEQQLSKLNADLTAARTTAAETMGRLEIVRQTAAISTTLETMPEAVRSNLIQGLREQLAEASRREASLSTRLLPRHPLLLEARAQIADIRRQIQDELKRLAQALNVEYQIAISRERQIALVIEKSKSDVARTTTAQIKLRELQQDATTSRELLGQFLQRGKETREQEQISTPYARIVSPASVPAMPTWPINWLVLTLGTLAGLGMGTLRAVVIETTRKDTHLKEAMEVVREIPQPRVAPAPVAAELTQEEPARDPATQATAEDVVSKPPIFVEPVVEAPLAPAPIVPPPVPERAASAAPEESHDLTSPASEPVRIALEPTPVAVPPSGTLEVAARGPETVARADAARIEISAPQVAPTAVHEATPAPSQLTPVQPVELPVSTLPIAFLAPRRPPIKRSVLRSIFGGPVQNVEPTWSALAAVSRPDTEGEARYKSSIESMRASLNLDDREGGAKVVLAFGTKPSVGTTTTVVALANTCAWHGTRVLIIDANVRSPKISYLFGHHMVGTAMSGVGTQRPLRESVIEDTRTGLCILPLALGQLGRLKIAERDAVLASLKSIAGYFDVVLIDAGTTDADRTAFFLMGMASQIALIARDDSSCAVDCSSTLQRIGVNRERVTALYRVCRSDRTS